MAILLRAKATVNCELFIEDLLSILTGPSLTLTIKSFSKFAGDTDTVMTYDTIRYEVGAHRTCSIHAVYMQYIIHTPNLGIKFRLRPDNFL